jgi:hypothetical protein
MPADERIERNSEGAARVHFRKEFILNHLRGTEG